MIDDDMSVFQVAPDADLPDRCPETDDAPGYADLLAMIDRGIVPGLELMAAAQTGEFDQVLWFAAVSGRPGEKMTKAEVEYIIAPARVALATFGMVVAALSGRFFLNRRGDEVTIGVRERFRDELQQAAE